MKILENRFIPFDGFLCLNFFGIILVRKGWKHAVGAVDINHERIHTAQMKEMGYILFYVWYFIEWLVRLPFKGNAYRNISFEREAYLHQSDLDYLNRRKHYAWWGHL
ncbi:hypothetical protein [Porphyromonas levii]|uniref:DUF4157 domain-containing protein n=1 Tax=Porphyromonas levii TaxID=28114 RepID=A0A4Y8WQ73_9PORP|nr:hypothetical protein [Porphyromonas levii]MBR8703498.1 hypothetical protein [Porphyromonas levii]MBR8713685.1 hypothetical protein [Porphyromonas levii]MBR8715706.1 hypothetical protein [Porphyromonas levii]MBR8728246.1 hypothetical protein [Porphyromonas levii]MBR8736579.1 hypothetical protein [Porphyromonas levii]